MSPLSFGRHELHDPIADCIDFHRSANRSGKTCDDPHQRSRQPADHGFHRADPRRTHIPDKKTKLLIYCNNNFEGDPRSMPMKRAPASLNIMTMVNLHTYERKNVFELAPYQQIEKSKNSLGEKMIAREYSSPANPLERMSAVATPHPHTAFFC